MLRALLALLLGTLLAWFIRRGSRPAPLGKTPPKPVGGQMVRDRICDTFLPRDRAIELRRGEERLFFCSTECRDRYLTQAQDGR